jgi:hypothetical protein
MLTEEQLSSIFDAVAEKYSGYLDSEKGSTVFENFKSAIQQMNQPIDRVDELIASGSAVVTNFLKDLEQTNKSSQSVTARVSEKELAAFKGKLNGFKVTLQNLLMNSSRAIFLSEAEKEAMCLGIDEEAISKLITLAAHPNFFGQFKTIVNKLEKAFNKDLQLKTAIESALKACNPQVSLEDPRRQENLRALINSTVQNNESLLYIVQNLNIVSTQRFADMNMKDISLSSFKKEVLLEAYRTSLEGRSESPFDSEGYISKFTQHFLDHLVPATTYAAAVTLEKTISLKEQEELPEANLKKTNEKGSYELRRINITPIDTDNPQHWLCYHLGDAVNCCLHAGGNSEQCIIDGLTKSTSGFYVITEKKGKGNAKEKICAAIYAFMSRKGNLVLDSIEPLNAHDKSEYASVVHDLVMEFAARVVQDTQREHPIQRVCLGTGGNTDLCFYEDTLTHKALPFKHEQTQEGTLQYGDSQRVVVLAHSAAEEERLQALINTLVGTREESDIEDAQRLRIIVRELLLTYCSALFYIKETDNVEQYIAHLKSKGLQQSFQRDEASEIQGLLTLESFYKEAFTLMLRWVCQDRNIDFMNFFLKKGVDINTTDSHGKTALCTACRYGQTDTIRLLLDKVANINLADKKGKTPLFWAVRNGHIGAINASSGLEFKLTL